MENYKDYWKDWEYNTDVDDDNESEWEDCVETLNIDLNLIRI